MSLAPEVVRRNHPICQEVFTLRETEGWSCARISREVGIHVSTVKRWLATPDWFDPFWDEVALMRALEGDRPVFRSLNYWEKPEFYRRLAATRLSMTMTEWREHVAYLSDLLDVPGEELTRTLVVRERELA